ncbi:MAG TPA: DNA recombination protein RmuC [Gammaproteobacteria bacterium]|nr:DNA recombination protein RmuC [Gammaproteobacteria bacterium]
MTVIIISVISGLALVLLAFSIRHTLLDQLHRFKLEIVEQLIDKHSMQQNQQLQYQKTLQDTLRESLSHHSQELSKSVENLTKTAEAKLQQVNQVVEQRLNDGFAKTTETFADIAKRLVLIDEAQRKLTDLSNNVLGLQEILADKRSRGAFGEIQLNNLIKNMLPAANFALQHQLSNGMRCDCILFLPAPTGNVVIDAKFPLENFQRYNDISVGEADKKKFMQTFNQDVKKHVNDIALKYIIPGETANGAIMFIPAEAIFAEIHSKFPDLVIFAQEKCVWLTSPTTMMAILTTACAVLKDSATREHIHYIQEHLRLLAKDFMLFNERMDKLAKHLEAANADAKDIHISAGKISKRFNAIEKVEIIDEV